MKKLLLLATGGTIAATPSERGLTPTVAAAALLSYLDMNCSHVTAEELFNMDSSNVQPEEWTVMARRIRDAAGEYDGVVVTHGTDTMAYSSSMLSFMLAGIPIPVVLTGAQKSIVEPDSDGRQNLKDAIVAAGALSGGVYICFEGMVIKGCRAVKTRTTSYNAFESINYPYIAKVEHGVCVMLSREAAEGAFDYFDAIDPNAALIKLIPGTSPRLIESVADCGISGIVIEAFGLGGVHNIRRDHVAAIRSLIARGIPVVIASQCLYEPSTPGVYEVGRPLVEAGAISAADMTTEAAVTKLMWALGHTKIPAEIAALMERGVAGEITR